ncbi:MAG: hypothetical protein IJ545_07280 [Alphaproteobacteria bacterium]|nr:hypothetical protein [Alphaproteobacteria bacterium]
MRSFYLFGVKLERLRRAECRHLRKFVKWCAFALRLCARVTHCAPQATGSAVYLAPNISGATIPDRKLR